MSADHRAIKRLRNIGIVAHIDAGKTTTTECMLYYSGREHRLGYVDEGSTVTDYLQDERDRGITIVSAAVTFPWSLTRPRASATGAPPNGETYSINLIDTPGHVDFTAEVERCLRVLDGAVVIFDAVAGVQPQSETVWRQADRYRVPRLCFINKMDRPGADFAAACASIARRLHAEPLPLQLPVGQEERFQGVIDLIERQLAHHPEGDTEGTKMRWVEVPEALRGEVERHRRRMIEKIAENDEEVLDFFAADSEPPPATLRAAIRRLTLASGSAQTAGVVPVLCGAAFRHRGVKPLMDAIIDYLPSPHDVPPPAGHVPGTEVETSLAPYPDQPFSALAFKTISDRYGELTYARIYSGTLRRGDRLYNANRARKERASQLVRIYADQQEEITEAGAGDIVGLRGLKFTLTGDTLCTEEKPLVYQHMRFPDTVISAALEPRTSADKDRLALSLQKIAKDDPTFRYGTNPETGQLLISGMGELHLEIIESRLVREHGVNVRTGTPRVNYRETIARPAEINEKFARQTGGHGQYARVELQIEPFPNEAEGHLAFESCLTGGVIPKEFLPAVEQGVRDAAGAGPIGGYQVINVKVRLVGGDYHEVDSSSIAFRSCAAIAMRKLCEKAAPVLLEPYMRVEIESPEEYLGNLVKDLNARRAEIQEVRHENPLAKIRALAPLGEMFGYSTAVRNQSQGRATYAMEPCEYRPVPKNRYREVLGYDWP